MSELLQRIKKASVIKETSVFSASTLLHNRDMVSTSVPALNIAFAGDLDKGFESGLTVFAGPSKHFKTLIMLLAAKAYLNTYSDAVMIFYDSEFGASDEYFQSMGIDTSRVVHIPIKNIEELKFDVMQQLEMIKRGDKVFIGIDSVGNLASLKEMEDAINGKSVADMSRAKQLKGLFRMVTPYLTMNDIPMFAVAHTYQTQEMFSKTVVSGGTGIYYSASQIFIMGRQQEKDTEGLTGYNYIINVEKSRTVREKAKIPLTVLFDSGINKYSGLLDIAIELNAVVKHPGGWYSKIDLESGEVDAKKVRARDTDNEEFWGSYLESVKFKQLIRDMYQLSSHNISGDVENVK